MPHPRVTPWSLAGVTASALLATSLSAVPAQAAWTDVGDFTDYRICRSATPSGNGWKFLSRVRKDDDTPDARVGMVLRDREHQRRARWRSGWLDDEPARGAARIRKSPQVRVQVWEEAGDLDSPVGTAIQATVYKPRQIKRCS